MEQIENGIFEKKHRPIGCLFVLLGTSMLGVIIMVVLPPLVSEASQFHWQVTPLLLILGCIAYFCFSRCFTRTSIGIYPTHIIIDNKKFLWLDIKSITFQRCKKWSTIYVDFNNKKHIRSNMIILSIMIALCISLIVIAFTIPKRIPELWYGIPWAFVIFPAMFGINIKKPKSRETSVDPNESDTVLRLLKYYADIHQISLEYKEEKK